MPIQSGTFTVIHFKHIWFLGSWTQSALINFYEYTAGKAAKLVVVEEIRLFADYSGSFFGLLARICDDASV